MIAGDFLLLIFLMVLCLVLIAKRIPLIGVPFGIFTFYISVAYFLELEATDIPANPFTTLLLTIFACCVLIAQGLELKK